jgi:hypothetical protein
MRRPTIVLAMLLIAMPAVMATKSWMVQAPPLRTQPAPGEFNAQRAKARLAFVLGDQRPHPADTDADDQVRGRIVGTLREMGFNPIERDQLACNELYKQRGVSCARVRNVIVALGPQYGKALLLNAHYDSTPVGPAAADDGIGVATLLEVASLLKDKPLKRPLILLFNEGEELGLIGARAFLADPLSQQVDSIVNLEARGVRGPVNMFETSLPNGAPIAVFARAVRNPIANSLSTDVYRLLPNYTDVNSFSSRGWLTLNLAPIGNETRYHSPGDDIAALDPATLQHMGDQTLALARALTSGTPEANGDNRIFMDVTGRALITLPLMVGIVLLAASLLAAVLLARKRRQVAPGIGVSIGTILGSGALAWFALAIIGGVRRGMFWRAEPVWTHAAAYSSVLVVGVFLLATLGRRMNLEQLRASFWIVFLAVGALIGLIAPGGIVFFIFPPLIALGGMLLARWWKPAEVIGAMLAILVLYLTWGAMLGLLEELLNGGPMWVFAPLGALLLLPVLIEATPLIDASRTRPAVTVAAILTLIAWSAAALAPAYSADRQQRFAIQHVSDVSSGKSSWSILNDGAPLPDAFRSVGRWKRGKLGFSDRPRWIATAPTDSAAKAPSVQLISTVRNGEERTLLLRLSANGNEHVNLLAPQDARIRTAGVAAFVRPVDSSENGKYSIDCFGRSCDGLTLQLTTGQMKPIEFLVLGGRAPLPPSASPLLAARPRFARPQYNRDEAMAFTRVRL